MDLRFIELAKEIKKLNKDFVFKRYCKSVKIDIDYIELFLVK